jgi:hypothetical protein
VPGGSGDQKPFRSESHVMEDVMPAAAQACVFCAHPLDPAVDNYVVLNRETAQSPEQGEYAHAACYQPQKDQPTE